MLTPRTRVGLALLLQLIVAVPAWADPVPPPPLRLQGVGRGHTQRIYRGVFTPDSKTFLSVGIDQVVRAWNVADGASLYTLSGHTSSIHGVGLSGDRLLVTGGENGDVFLWDLTTRQMVGKLGKTKHSLHCLTVSRDGKLLATGGGEWKSHTPGELRLWDLTSREEIALLKGHRRLVLGVAFSPDSRLLAAVDYSGDLHIWDLVTRKPLVTLFQENPAGAVAFSPDGKFLVVGDYRGRLNVHDTANWLDDGVVRGNPGGVMWLSYSTRGNLLASAGWNGSVTLWDGHDVEAVLPLHVTDHPDKAWMVAFSPDGKTLATAGEDRLVKFWAIPPEFDQRYRPTPARAVTAPSPARTGAARVALLTAYPLDDARNLQDLALVKLSEEKGIVLLQRDAVDKLLREQQLTQSGLVQAQTAVQLGKILAVDVIGVIDVSLEAKQALGFVLFDAVTGVRLHDDGFAGDKTDQQVRAIVGGVRAGVEKWRAGPGQLKTVCVLPARNADLPRGMDVFCEAMGSTLERQLLQHPSITTLERKWLDSVNQEKTLAPAALTRELLASVLIVDLEIARGPQGKGLRGTLTLRDNAGKVLHRFAHQVEDDHGGELLGPLLKRIHEALHTTQSSALVKPSREARRFLRETDILWKHRYFRQALQAAEAAYALRPDDESRLRLAECLLQYPSEMWRKKREASDRNAYPPVERTAEEVRVGLGMVYRGYRLVDAAKPRVEELPDHGWYYSRAESGVCFYADTLTWAALKAITVTPADASIAEDILEFRKTCLRRLLDRLEEIAAMKKRTPKEKLQRMTPGLRSNYVHYFEELAPNAAAYQEALTKAARIWLNLAAQTPAEAFPVETVSMFAESVLGPLYGQRRGKGKQPAAPAEVSPAILQALLTHAHPLLRLYGAHYRMKQQLALRTIDPQNAATIFQENLDQARRWIDQVPFKDPSPHRVGLYQFCQLVLEDAQQHQDAKVVDHAYAALGEYMLERKDVAGWVTISVVGYKVPERTLLFNTLQRLRRFKEMYEAPEHRLFHDPDKAVPRQLEYYQEMVLRIAPELASQKLVVPWDKVVRLAEVETLEGTIHFFTPVRHDNHVYFLAGIHEVGQQNQVYLQLRRVALGGGPVQLLGKLPISPRGYHGKTPQYAFSYGSSIPYVAQSLIHGNQFIVGTSYDGMYLFPLDGGAPTRLGEKEGLPSQEVAVLAALDNRVVASLTGGYLVQIDLTTRRVEVLASSRRTNKLSPFDDERPFVVRSMLADPPRQRVLFTMSPGTNDHPNVGMWEYNLQTRQFRKRLPMFRFRFSDIHEGVVYLEQYQRDWVARYDLATDQFTLLQGKNPNGLEKLEPAGLPKQFSARFPERLYHGGFVWEAGPLARRSLASDKTEPLPHMTRGYRVQVYARECLEPISPNELLVGDWRGLYVVQLKK